MVVDVGPTLALTVTTPVAEVPPLTLPVNEIAPTSPSHTPVRSRTNIPNTRIILDAHPRMALL